jgi:hypothetical protein
VPCSSPCPSSSIKNIGGLSSHHLASHRIASPLHLQRQNFNPSEPETRALFLFISSLIDTHLNYRAVTQWCNTSYESGISSHTTDPSNVFFKLHPASSRLPPAATIKRWLQMASHLAPQAVFHHGTRPSCCSQTTELLRAQTLQTPLMGSFHLLLCSRIKCTSRDLK